VIAAAGIVALTEMVDRLSEDHDNAHKLAEGLVDAEGLSVDPGSVQTNIVYMNITKDDLLSAHLAEQLAREGVLLLPTGPRQLRAVTNYHIAADDVDYAAAVIRKGLQG